MTVDYVAAMPSWPQAWVRLSVLSAHLACSSSQARRAVRELEGQGLLLRQAHFGTYGEQRSNDYVALDGAAWPWFAVGGEADGQLEARVIVSALMRCAGWVDPERDELAAQLAHWLVAATGAAGLAPRNDREPPADATDPPCHLCEPYQDAGSGNAESLQQHAAPQRTELHAVSRVAPVALVAASSSSSLSESRSQRADVSGAALPCDSSQTAPPAVSLMTRKRLERATPEHAFAVLALVSKTQHRELAEHAVSQLLRALEQRDVVSPAGYVARVLSDELKARAQASRAGGGAPPPVSVIDDEPPRRAPARAPVSARDNQLIALRARLATAHAQSPAAARLRALITITEGGESLAHAVVASLIAATGARPRLIECCARVGRE